MIGVGRWGQVYIKTLLALGERCRLTHLGTSRPEHAALVPHPVEVAADWRQLLRADCDALIIATPPHTHAEILEACLAAGKPCLVDKPLCLDVATAQRLHRNVQSAGIPVLVNHTHLFDAAYAALKRELDSAREPIRAILSEGMSLGVFRSDTPALWDWASHDVSLCLDLLGAVPARVDALGGPRDPQGVPEQVSLRLEFPGSACAWIHAGRLSPVKRRHLSVFTNHHLYAWDALAPTPLTVSPIDFAARCQGGVPRPDGLERRPVDGAAGSPPMERVVAYFLDGLSGGDRRLFGTALALDVTRVLAGAAARMERAG
ncbi:MAG: Gfo/Idh/MocA family oxidoreductase [Candidatus Omnitrophica bacterium]|nr:Gfo/Idh/MocA family oxidoreductase [Candidatus Omnitrophota bacterium]